MKKISVFGLFLLYCFFFLSCGKDSKIKEILKETHEEEIKESVESFNSLSQTTDNFFYVTEYGFISYTPKYIEESINNIIQKYESLTHLDIIFIYYSLNFSTISIS